LFPSRVFVFAQFAKKETTEMKELNTFGVKCFAVMVAALLVLAAPALAGPPLICHAIDIGTAESLPWTSTGWNLTGQETYDVTQLVADTLGLLGPSTPVLVRMETLRRATLYAQQRTAIAKELLLRLEARTRDNPTDALAAFDFGYLAECYKQASWLHQHTDSLKKANSGEIVVSANAARSIDGYTWVQRAIALRGSDPQMEFAAALMSTEGAGSERNKHLEKAMAGAKTDATLARNLASRFPKNGA
jgi:hypothetical protein